MRRSDARSLKGKRVLTPRDPDRRPMRDLILQAAEAEFAQAGRDAASTRAIATRAGCAQGLLRYYFPTKEALWLEVGRKIANDFFAFYEGFFDQSSPNSGSIREALITYWRFWLNHPTAARLHLWRQMETPTPESIAREVANNTHAKAFFERAQAAGAIRRDVSSDVIMFVLASAIINGVLQARYAGVPDETILIDALMRMVGASD